MSAPVSTVWILSIFISQEDLPDKSDLKSPINLVNAQTHE